MALWEHLYGLVSAVAREEIQDRLERHGPELLLKALEATKQANVKRLDYLDAVLAHWGEPKPAAAPPARASPRARASPAPAAPLPTFSQGLTAEEQRRNELALERFG